MAWKNWFRWITMSLAGRVALAHSKVEELAAYYRNLNSSHYQLVQRVGQLEMKLAAGEPAGEPPPLEEPQVQSDG